MSSQRFSQGDRVKISAECFWAKGASGAVMLPPSKVQQVAGDWNGVWRAVNTPRGTKTFYWIQFYEPQLDHGGDGPFFGAEFEDVYLSLDSGTSEKLVQVPDDRVEAVWFENPTLDLKVEFKAFLITKAS